MRIIALIAARNEQRFIAQCLIHLHSQGIETVLIDNDSTDSTIKLAQQFKQYGLKYIIHHPYQDEFNLKEILALKQQLACDLDADWFMHQDVDEFREPVQIGKRLIDLVSEIDSQGFNAVDFMEYTFIPTAEEPNHEHAHFQDTMRWYYPFFPKPNHRTNLWKKNLNADLVSNAGHQVLFNGINIYPQSQILRHYQILSKKHVIDKYCERKFSKKVIQQYGWHRARLNINADKVAFPSANALKYWPNNFTSLDSANPRTKHVFEAWIDALPKQDLLSPEPELQTQLAQLNNQLKQQENDMLAIQQENIILKQQVVKSNEDKTNIEQHLQHTIETLKQDNYQLQVKLYAQLVDAISRRYKAQAELFSQFAEAADQRDKLSLTLQVSTQKQKETTQQLQKLLDNTELLNTEVIRARYHYLDIQKQTQWRIIKPLWRIFQKLYLLRQRSRIQKLCENVLQLKLINPEAYLSAYPDIRLSNLPPAEHYLRYGWLENRTAGVVFDPISYLRANPDVLNQGINPLIHYIENGRQENRPLKINQIDQEYKNSIKPNKIPPIAIGGIGGSGTRVVAQILAKLGLYMGDDISEENDNLWFTLLFKRLEILQINNSEFHQLISIFIRAMTSTTPFTKEEINIVNQLSQKDRPNHDKTWLNFRSQSLISASIRREEAPTAWGWKEPNTHIILDRLLHNIDNLKYIHVMRNGLDMAYSTNQAQLMLWGEYFLNEGPVTPKPRHSLKYWCAVHKRIRQINSAFPDRVMILNFDDLCRAPVESIAQIALFIGLSISNDALTQIATLVKQPETTNRYKKNSIMDFDLDDVHFVAEMGFKSTI